MPFRLPTPRFLRHADKGKASNRVVLVSPPSSYSSNHPVVPMMPLGSACLAASLEAAGVDARIVDLTFIFQQSIGIGDVARSVLRLEPSVVGISSYTSTIPSAYRLAKALRQERAGLPIVVGGAHVSALPERTLQECEGIDAVVAGEGDEVFPELTRRFMQDGRSADLSGIRGVLARDGDELAGDPSPVYVDDVDSLPLPARHLLDLSTYIRHSYHEKAKRWPIANMVTSRGCPFSCVFCSRSNNGKRYRPRSPEKVLEELKELRRRGFREVQIVDDNFTADRERVLEICRLIRSEGLDMSFCTPNGIRVDSVDEEVLTEMYRAGFYAVAFGAESGDDAVLEKIMKGITSSDILRAVRAAKRIGFYVSLFSIIGLPGSSVESEKRTLRLVRESGADSTTASVCTPYPGSALWEMVKDRVRDIPWERYNESDVSNPIYLADGLTPEQLQFWLKEAQG
jgi:anaerobic magnesium-protoporphyrin IX monomethyl ester cyclase